MKKKKNKKKSLSKIEMLTVEEVAYMENRDYYTLRKTLQKKYDEDPSKMDYPVSMSGNRMKVYKDAYLAYAAGKRGGAGSE